MIRTEGISTSRKTEGPYLRKKVQLRGYVRGQKLTVLDVLEADLIFSDTFWGITKQGENLDVTHCLAPYSKSLNIYLTESISELTYMQASIQNEV